MQTQVELSHFIGGRRKAAAEERARALTTTDAVTHSVTHSLSHSVTQSLTRCAQPAKRPRDLNSDCAVCSVDGCCCCLAASHGCNLRRHLGRRLVVVITFSPPFSHPPRLVHPSSFCLHPCRLAHRRFPPTTQPLETIVASFPARLHHSLVSSFRSALLRRSTAFRRNQKQGLICFHQSHRDFVYPYIATCIRAHRTPP